MKRLLSRLAILLVVACGAAFADELINPMQVTCALTGPTPSDMKAGDSETVTATLTWNPGSNPGGVFEWSASPSGIVTIQGEASWKSDSSTSDTSSVAVKGIGTGSVTITVKWVGPTTATASTSAKVSSKVKITTSSSSFKVRQENDSSQSLTAERTPSGGAVKWEITGSGKDFVETQSEETNPSTITIKIKRPVPGAWTDDSKITVRAYDRDDANAYDEKTVDLIKFRRDHTVSPGSQPIRIPLKFQFNSSTANSGVACENGNLVAVMCLGEIMQTIQQQPHVDAKTREWKAFYNGWGDACAGKYSMFARCRTTYGRGKVAGNYQGWFHNASVYMAAGASMGFDNTGFPLSDPSCGAGYDGTLISHSISLGIGYDGKAVSAGAGYAVSFSCSEQDMLFTSCTPDGIGVIENVTDIAHSEGGVIERPHVLNIGTSLVLEQRNDDEWFLDGEASMTLNIIDDKNSVLSFYPDI